MSERMADIDSDSLSPSTSSEERSEAKTGQALVDAHRLQVLSETGEYLLCWLIRKSGNPRKGSILLIWRERRDLNPRSPA